MSVEQKTAYIDEQARRRDQLKTEIAELTAQRQGYLSEQYASEPSADAFDARIGEAVKEQAAAKGFSYHQDDDS